MAVFRAHFKSSIMLRRVLVTLIVVTLVPHVCNIIMCSVAEVWYYYRPG